MAGKTFRQLAAETSPALTRIFPTQDPSSGEPTKTTLAQLFAVAPVLANSGLADMDAATIKGRASGAGTGDPTDLTATQVRTILNVEDGAAADQDADEVPYDNGSSGLTATDVQAAIDELETGMAPAGTSQIVYRDGDGAMALITIGDNLSLVDEELSADALAGVAGDTVEIDGTSVLTSGQQHTGYDGGGSELLQRACYVHNTANQAAAVVLSVPWDPTVAYPGASWVITRGSAYTGALTIDREVKTIDRAGTTTNGSPVVTGLSATNDLDVGATVTGTGIPGATTIDSIDSASQITLSANATADSTPTLTFNSGKQGTLNNGAAALTVSLVASATVTIRVVASDNADDDPVVRVEGDLDETTTLLAPLDCNDELVIDALLSGATLNDALDANGQIISGLLESVVTGVSGTLSVAAHCGRHCVLNGNATIPTTVGFFGKLEADSSRTITFNSLTRAMAAGDILTFTVTGSTTIRAVHTLAADLATFA